MLGTFITQPSDSPSGLTLVIKMKYDHTDLNANDEKFILDTGGWLGHGVSVFVQNGILYAVVGSSGRVWVVSIELHFVCMFTRLLMSLP